MPLSFKRNSEGQGSGYTCDNILNNANEEFFMNMQKAA